MRILVAAIFIFAMGLGTVARPQFRLHSGNLVPTFEAEDISGNNVDLEKHEGSVVLLMFWTTRCEICLVEFPKLNQMMQRHKSERLTLLAATTDNAAMAGQYLKRRPIEGTVLPDSFGLLLKYADRSEDGTIRIGFPAYFLIDQEGKLAMRTEGYDKIPKLEAKIKDLLSLK